MSVMNRKAMKEPAEVIIEFVIGLHTVEVIRAETEAEGVWYDGWIDQQPGIQNERNLEDLLRKLWLKLGDRKLAV